MASCDNPACIGGMGACSPARGSSLGLPSALSHPPSSDSLSLYHFIVLLLQTGVLTHDTEPRLKATGLKREGRGTHRGQSLPAWQQLLLVALMNVPFITVNEKQVQLRAQETAAKPPC